MDFLGNPFPHKAPQPPSFAHIHIISIRALRSPLELSPCPIFRRIQVLHGPFCTPLLLSHFRHAKCVDWKWAEAVATDDPCILSSFPLTIPIPDSKLCWLKQPTEQNHSFPNRTLSIRTAQEIPRFAHCFISTPFIHSTITSISRASLPLAYLYYSSFFAIDILQINTHKFIPFPNHQINNFTPELMNYYLWVMTIL